MALFSWSVCPGCSRSRRHRRAACASSSTARSAGRRRSRRWRSRRATTRCRCAPRDTPAFTTRLTMAGGGEKQTLRARPRPGPRGGRVLLRACGRERARGRCRGRPHAAHRRPQLGRARGEGGARGLRPATRSIQVVAEQPLTVPTFRLEPLPGRLRLTSEPAGRGGQRGRRVPGETPLELDGVAATRPRGPPDEGRARVGGGERARWTWTRRAPSPSCSLPGWGRWR